MSERKIKVLLLGDANTGKPSILNILTKSSNTEYKATISNDYSTKKININGKDITLELWDTSGQERYRSLGPTFYRGTDICVLVYDVMNQQSFDNIDKWRKDFISQIGLSPEKYFPFLLIGNGSNKPDKVVSESTAQQYADKYNMLFYEVSTEDHDNINAAFEAITQKALENAPKDDFQIPGSVANLENKGDSDKSTCQIE